MSEELAQTDYVEKRRWVSQAEFDEAVMVVVRITPSPVVISSVFIGYKVAGFLGAVFAMGAISLPTFFYSIAAAHQLHRLRNNLRVRAFLKRVGPAVVGMIRAAGFTIARASLVDIWTAILALACLAALVRFKMDASLVIVGAGVIGFFLG